MDWERSTFAYDYEFYQSNNFLPERIESESKCQQVNKDDFNAFISHLIGEVIFLSPQLICSELATKILKASFGQ